MKQLPAFFTLAFLCFYFGTKAQTTTWPKPQPVTIKYDFSTSQFDKLPQWIKEGSTIQVQYLNVNKYAIKSSATITSANRNYDDELTQLQQGIQQLAPEKKK